MNINDLYKQTEGGDRAAEERLFQALSARLRLFVYHRVWNEDDAEEIIQDVLTNISREYKGMECEQSFSTWSYNMLLNKIRHFVRQKKYQDSSVNLSVEKDTTYGSRSPNSELQQQILNCLNVIIKENVRYARVLNLKYHRYSVSEICDKLGISINILFVIVSRARVILKACLKKAGATK